MTATANTAFTAAQFNTHVRDNLNETAVAKATTTGRIFVATGANAIAERAIDGATVATSESTTSTSYTDLATSGPAVTVTTGTKALVFISCRLAMGTVGDISHMSYAVSSATTIAAGDAFSTSWETAVSNDFLRCGITNFVSTLTPGSNIFTAKYRSSSGGTANFRDRHIAVIAL